MENDRSYQKMKALVLEGNKKCLTNLSIDCVVFGFHEGQLNVLLLKWKYTDLWALPGGHIGKQEAIDDAARRILNERTRLENIYLKQFQTFGEPSRTNPKGVKALFEKFGVKAKDKSWMLDRFISIGYYALVDFTRVKPLPGPFSDNFEWCDIHKIPGLIMDHNQIVESAWEALKNQLSYEPVGFNLLPEKFTMPELQRLYETILNRDLDRRNFQKKMLATGLLKRLNDRKTGGAHRAPYYFKFELKNGSDQTYSFY